MERCVRGKVQRSAGAGQVLAPDNGVISARARTGAVSAPARNCSMTAARLEWRAEIRDPDLGSIKPGKAVRVTTAGGSAGQGKVRMVAPTVGPATATASSVDLPASRSRARVARVVRGRECCGGERGRPAAARDPAADTVLIARRFCLGLKVGSDNKVQQSKVDVGRRVADRVEVINGLDINTRVVATGGGFLADGDLVRVVAAVPAASAAVK